MNNILCPKCGAEIDRRALTCSKCGNPIGYSEGQSPPLVRPAARDEFASLVTSARKLREVSRRNPGDEHAQDGSVNRVWSWAVCVLVGFAALLIGTYLGLGVFAVAAAALAWLAAMKATQGGWLNVWQRALTSALLVCVLIVGVVSGGMVRFDNRGSQEAAEHTSTGLSLHEAGMLKEALAEFDRALAISKSPGAYNNRGAVFLALGQSQRAIQDFDEAIDLDAKFADAWNSRGVGYLALGDDTRAVADFDEAIRLDPKMFQAYTNRSNAYLRQGEADAARRDSSKAIRLKPDYADAYNSSGNVSLFLQQYERAIEDFDKAIELDPGYASAVNNRGFAYMWLRQGAAALRDFDESIRLDPETPFVYGNRAVALALLGRNEDALLALEMAVRSGEDRSTVERWMSEFSLQP